MTLLSLGVLVLLGFFAARALRRFHLPAVTGYLLAGIVIGPSVLHGVGAETVTALKPLVNFCLAVIFFLLGEEFKLAELKKLGPRFLSITVVQSLVTFALVAGLATLAHAPLPIALLLGAIAGTTDPAATLAVIREARAKGELVQVLLAVVALNSLVEMVIFSLLLPLVDLVQHGGALSWTQLLAGPAHEIGGSIAVGAGLAIALRTWSLTPWGKDALKLPTLGLILMGSGAAESLHLSLLLVMLAMGAVVANTVPFKIAIFDLAKAMEGPLLVVFFTLSGVNLHLQELGALGWLGAAYAGGRLLGKLTGASLGASLAGTSEACRRYLGFGLIPQASMAIGLAIVVQQRFPDIAGPIVPICLGAVVLFEGIGPLLTRMAIMRTEGAPATRAEGAIALPRPGLTH